MDDIAFKQLFRFPKHLAVSLILGLAVGTAVGPPSVLLSARRRDTLDVERKVTQATHWSPGF